MYGITEPLGLLEMLIQNESNLYLEAGVYRFKKDHYLYGKYNLTIGLKGERLYCWYSPKWINLHVHLYGDEDSKKEEWVGHMNPILLQYAGKEEC